MRKSPRGRKGEEKCEYFAIENVDSSEEELVRGKKVSRYER